LRKNRIVGPELRKRKERKSENKSQKSQTLGELQRKEGVKKLEVGRVTQTVRGTRMFLPRLVKRKNPGGQ